MFKNMSTGGGGANNSGNAFAGFTDNDPLLTGDDIPVADPVESVKQQLIEGMITPSQARELLISFNYPNADALIRSWTEEAGIPPTGIGMDYPDDPLLGATQFDDPVSPPIIDDGIGDPIIMGDGMGGNVPVSPPVVVTPPVGGTPNIPELGGNVPVPPPIVVTPPVGGTPNAPGFDMTGGNVPVGGNVPTGGNVPSGGNVPTGGNVPVGGNNLLPDQMGNTSTIPGTLWSTTLSPYERYTQRMLSRFQDAPIGAELAASDAIGYGYSPLYAQYQLAKGAGAFTPESDIDADMGEGQAFMDFLDRRKQNKVGDMRQQYTQLARSLSSLGKGELAPGSAGFLEIYGSGDPNAPGFGKERSKLLAASRAALGLTGKGSGALGSIYDVMQRRYGAGGRGKFADWVSGAFGERGLAKRQAEEQASNPFISFDGRSPELNF